MKCNECKSGTFIPRYRKNKAPKFYCSKCGKRHHPKVKKT